MSDFRLPVTIEKKTYQKYETITSISNQVTIFFFLLNHGAAGGNFSLFPYWGILPPAFTYFIDKMNTYKTIQLHTSTVRTNRKKTPNWLSIYNKIFNSTLRWKSSNLVLNLYLKIPGSVIVAYHYIYRPITGLT